MFSIRQKELVTGLLAILAFMAAWCFPWILRITMHILSRLLFAGAVGFAAYKLFYRFFK